MKTYTKQTNGYDLNNLSSGHKILMVCAIEGVSYEKAVKLLGPAKKPEDLKGDGHFLFLLCLMLLFIAFI